LEQPTPEKNMYEKQKKLHCCIYRYPAAKRIGGRVAATDHDDLRIQHPEWVQPNGESPTCDSYEARLMELLAPNAKGLS